MYLLDLMVYAVQLCASCFQVGVFCTRDYFVPIYVCINEQVCFNNIILVVGVAGDIPVMSAVVLAKCH